MGLVYRKIIHDITHEWNSKVKSIEFPKQFKKMLSIFQIYKQL